MGSPISWFLNWSQTWVDFRPVRKNPWRPWFHVCALLFFIATFSLLVFWGLITVIWDNVPVMSNSFNHTDNYWFNFAKTQNLCDPTTLSVGGTYYTTNGLWPWTVSGTPLTDVWYREEYFPSSAWSLKLHHRYSGEMLDNCRPTTVTLTVDVGQKITEAKINAKCFIGDDGSYIALSTSRKIGITELGEMGIYSPSPTTTYLGNVMTDIDQIHTEFVANLRDRAPDATRIVSLARAMCQEETSESFEGPSCVEDRLLFSYITTVIYTTKTGDYASIFDAAQNSTYDWDLGFSHLLFAVAMWDLGRHDWKSSPLTNVTIAVAVLPHRTKLPPPPDATWQVQYLCNTRVLKSFWHAALSLLTSVFSLFSTVFSTFLLACVFIGDHSKYKAYFRLPDHPVPIGGEPEKDTLLGNDANNGDLPTSSRA